MQFEIPFEEKFSRKDSKLIFDRYWKEPLKKNKKLLYFILPTLLIGGLIIYGNDNIGFVFIAMGLYSLYKYKNLLNQYKISQKIYFKEVEKHVEAYLSHKQNIIWKFEDERFCYADYRMDLKINWFSFKEFEILDDSLILELRDNITAIFVLSKEEIGNQNFEAIIAFLETKIKKVL